MAVVAGDSSQIMWAAGPSIHTVAKAGEYTSARNWPTEPSPSIAA
jgi:hypothetical protein